MLDQLKQIEAVSGLNLVLCSHFTGVRFYKGMPYVNIELSCPYSSSGDVTKLKRLAHKYPTLLRNIEPNGYKRAALFLVPTDKTEKQEPFF